MTDYILKAQDRRTLQSLLAKREPIKKYWFHNNVFKSSFFDAGSISIPEAERTLVIIAKEAKEKITDDALLRDIDHLIDEEDKHVLVHDSYNHMLTKEGYRIDFFVRVTQ